MTINIVLKIQMEGCVHAKINQLVFLHFTGSDIVINIIVCIAAALTAR